MIPLLRDFSDDDIRRAALARIAVVFSLDPITVRPTMEFGVDLQASFVSDWRYNELDQMLHDIHDVADRAIEREFEYGSLVIRTVADYCEHMVRAFRTRRDDVVFVLKL